MSDTQEFKIYFVRYSGIQNLFCPILRNSKFILSNTQEFKIYFVQYLGVQNLFCPILRSSKQNKNLIATEAGIQLIQALPEAVKSTGTTALWEQSLEGIAEGTVSPKGFLISQQEWLTELISQEMQSSSLNITPNEGAGTKPKAIHFCPQCKNALNRRKGKNGFFWGCMGYPNCNFTANDKRGKPEIN